MARPRWVHSDGRPYDELDFGKTRVYDELDAKQHQAKLERTDGAPFLRRLVTRLRRGSRR